MSASEIIPPVADPAWAFFLDVDGTLLDLAPSPAAVRVGDEVHDLLHRLHAVTGGAVALVSGRAIRDIDALFPGAALPVAGQHGLERRDARGAHTSHVVGPDALTDALATLATLVRAHDGLVLENKGLSIALHYRAAPHLGALAVDTMRSLQVDLAPEYALQSGKFVIELKPVGADKGDAIAAFMREPPFRGRTPVFLGDDATDEHGFAVVNALHGHSVKVGQGPTLARWRLPDVRAVEQWLACASAEPPAISRAAGR